LLLFFIFLWSGCQKIEDTVDQDKFTNIEFSPINSNSYTSIVATRKDASAEISLSYFDPEFFYKERNYTIYPDYYEVYLSVNTPDNWELIKTIDTSYINKSFTISGLNNGVIYYIYLSDKSSLYDETRNSNVAVFIPSADKPSYDLILKDFYGQDIYAFDINNYNNKIVYATKRYQYQPGHSAASIFLSDSENEPQLIDIGCWSPSFSYNGEKISYSSDHGEFFDGILSPEHIVVYDVNTQITTKVTLGYSVNRYPAWAPTGYLIAYSSSDNGHLDFKINIYNTATSTNRILHTEYISNQDLISHSQEHPTWSSDGKYIYYTRRTYTSANRTSGYFDIYRIISNGGMPEPVFNSKGIECTPAISPDNSKLAFLANYNGSLQIWIYNFLYDEFYQPFDTNDFNFSEIWSLIRWKDNNTILFTACTVTDAALFSLTVE